MKAVLKQIFSPRRLIVWLFLIILILTVPEITRPSLSQTEAVVTMLCVDKKDDLIQVATTVLTPAQEKTANYEIFSGTGETIGEAIDNIALSMGKEMGFAQCEILGFGDKLCEEGIIPSLDFFIRTKRVGRNAVLLNFTGDAKEFAQAAADMSMKKSLKLNDVLNYDNRYILIEDSNVDSFYRGYFSDISLGIMPQIKFDVNETDNAIAVQGASNESAPLEKNKQKSEKYLINNGTIIVFKNGKKDLTIEPEIVKKINLFVNSAQEGVVKVENVHDDLYNDASVILNIQKKDTKIKTNFKDGKPVYEVKTNLTLLIEEVVSENPDKKFLRRNKDFFTPTLIKAVEEQVLNDMNEAIEFCKQNKVDLIDVYRHFNALKHEEFNGYLKDKKEDYLQDVEYKTSVKIALSY